MKWLFYAGTSVVYMVIPIIAFGAGTGRSLGKLSTSMSYGRTVTR